MDAETEKAYRHVRAGLTADFEQKHGLIVVYGKEAVQFLDGMITNDVKTLADGDQMLAALPNAQGRLLAVVRVLRQGDRFFIETEEATREKVYQNLFRFTFAGDFFVEDLSPSFRFVEIFNFEVTAPSTVLKFSVGRYATWAIPTDEWVSFCRTITDREYSDMTPDVFELFRIERGIPKYGVDMDETTVVPELRLDGMISYNKGCYIGQEIIARIHFRGHVAKQLTGLILSKPVTTDTELKTAEGKVAGRITSVTYSPALEKTIALGYVRYDNLAKDTKLFAGDAEATVVGLPFEV